MFVFVWNETFALYTHIVYIWMEMHLILEGIFCDLGDSVKEITTHIKSVWREVKAVLALSSPDDILKYICGYHKILPISKIIIFSGSKKV